MEMTVKVVGIDQRNDNGSCRQQLLRGCRRGESLQLVRDYGNRRDSNAVMVCRAGGRQIGYLSSWVAEAVGPDMDAGQAVTAQVKSLSGGGWIFRRTRALDILITVAEKRKRST